MDARIDVFRLLDLKEGDAQILRNAGGIVTDDMLRSLKLSQELLGTERIHLIHHTNCALEGRPDGFANVEDDVRVSMKRLRGSTLPRRDGVRGFVYDVVTRELREITA